jgi:tRNA1Val (adenine37-N6)-methyltransferase
MKNLTNEQPFVFRQFSVKHHLCAHKVGFDGVLLGAWTRLEQSAKILDIGTGSGLIALMAAQKNITADITAIEIDADSAGQAKQNFEESSWSHRLHLVHANFLDHHFDQGFDCVITNPPFYVDRIKAKGDQRSHARHLSNEELGAFILKTSQVLSPKGHFSMILPWSEWAEFKSLLFDAGYWIQRECSVFTRKVNEPERLLIECSLQKCEKQVSQLYIYGADGNYSAEYIKLTNPFYLNI